jgi:hypothetical protein
VKDLYEDTRKYPLVYDPSSDPVVVAEMEEMERDVKEGQLEKDVQDPDPSGSDLSDSDSDDEHEDLWVDEAEGQTEPESEADAGPDVEEMTKNGKGAGKGKKAKKAKPEKAFTPVDKVRVSNLEFFRYPHYFQIHASVVHILRSEIRRKKARVLIHKLADEEYRHLVFMRSMVIRWNTMYAEMQRARNPSAVGKIYSCWLCVLTALRHSMHLSQIWLAVSRASPNLQRLQKRKSGRCALRIGSSLTN